MTGSDRLSRDTLLSGSIQRDRRAARLLTTIEVRVAFLRSQLRRAMATHFLGSPDEAHPASRHDYLEGIKVSARTRERVTLEQLDAYAPQWAVLVPDDVALKLRLINLLVQRQGASVAGYPRLAAALGADDEAVRVEYESLTGSSLPLDGDAREPATRGESDDPLDRFEVGVEWLHLPGGSVLYATGEPGDALYVLITGRLRVLRPGEEQPVAEISRGEMVGESDVLLGDVRPVTVFAARDSELIRISRQSLIDLARQMPEIMARLNQVMASRLRSNWTRTGHARASSVTIALVATRQDLPLREVAVAVAAALGAEALHINRALAEREVGTQAMRSLDDVIERARLLSWLNERETGPLHILYEADTTLTEWTRLCVRQADRILFLADSGSDFAPTAIEQLVSEISPAARRETLLLQDPGLSLPRGTAEWQATRPGQTHYHVRPGHEADFRRLGRRLTGRATGLVLSGGGARGFVHVGVIRALREAGIELDLIGGTSMGALIGSIHALGHDYESMIDICRQFASRRSLLDLTLPLSSIFATRKVVTMLKSVMGDARIEDLWQPFFCISSNLTKASPMLHDEGPLWWAVRASLAIPVVFAPVLHEGSLLVDGGLMNNFPADIMRERCQHGLVVGCNASPPHEQEGDLDFGESLSGWHVLLSRLGLGGTRVRAPSLLSILMRSIELSGSYRLSAPGFLDLPDILVQPPIAQFGVLDFDSYRQIVDMGYESACREIDHWQRNPEER